MSFQMSGEQIRSGEMCVAARTEVFARVMVQAVAAEMFGSGKCLGAAWILASEGLLVGRSRTSFLRTCCHIGDLCSH